MVKLLKRGWMERETEHVAPWACRERLPLLNPGRDCLPPASYLSLLGLVAGCSLALLFPGACAGLPDGNWPGGKLAFEGAMRSSSGSIWKRFFPSSILSM